MPKTTFAEWLLARATNPLRAAAIMGDLLEISATRGRLWFWLSYLRTLITLGWRTGIPAFLFAFACLRFMFTTGMWWLMNHRTPSLRDAGLFAPNQHVRIIIWNLSMLTAQFLIFAFPFVFIRFGLRHRLTQLAGVLFLVSLPVYTLRPWWMDLSGVLAVIIIIAALIAPHWRRPLAVLAVTFFPASAIKGTLLFFLDFHHRSRFAVPASWVAVEDALSFAVASIVCLQMTRLLLRPRLASGDREVAPL